MRRSSIITQDAGSPGNERLANIYAAESLEMEQGKWRPVREHQSTDRGTDAIAARPAVQRGRKVNCTRGEPSGQLHERHDASDLETKTQDKVGDSNTTAGG
jgi:hypothetical protein